MDIRERSYWRHVGVTSLAGGSTFQRYYSDMAMLGDVTDDTLGGNLVATPYWSGPRSGSLLDQIAIGVTVAGSQQVRLGIYQNGTFVTSVYPGARIYASPELSTATVGLLTNSLGLTLVNDTLYWLVATTSGTAANFTSLNNGNWVVPLLLGAYSPTTSPIAYALSTAYAALPTTFPAEATSTNVHIPILGVRYGG